MKDTKTRIGGETVALKDPSVAHSATRTGGSELFIKTLINDSLPFSPSVASFLVFFIFVSPSFRFRDDKGYVLYPQIGDRLDLICPPLDTARSTPEYEFYKLYLVSTREQADRCEVMGPPNIVLTCDEPTRERRFTIKFQEFSPNLWGHEFKSMQDYYIIGEWRTLTKRWVDVCMCAYGRVC